MKKCNPQQTLDQQDPCADHPCFSETAHHYFARIHLPVAPGCNVQCNYCNRKYDCSNESRPGVVSERLSAQQALKKLYFVADATPELSVVGIAGPGDALASPQRSFATMELVKEHFPDLKLCLSTNGLELPQYATRIAELGVDHVTVTMNSLKPATVQKIYKWIKFKGKKSNDLAAMAHLIAQQVAGIRTLINLGVLVKVNSLLMPGINDQELPNLSRQLKLMGVTLHNIMPLIARPEHGTQFGLEGRPEPGDQELEAVREACGDMRQMAHCRQCRADAVGKLGEEGFLDYSAAALAEMELPQNNSAHKRQVWKARVAHQLGQPVPQSDASPGPARLVAVVTKGMGLVNQHFGHATEFLIYKVQGGRSRLVNVRRFGNPYCVGEDQCGDRETLLEEVIQGLSDCHALLCAKVGYSIYARLESQGILPVVDLAGEPIEKAVLEAAQRQGVAKPQATAQLMEAQ